MSDCAPRQEVPANAGAAIGAHLDMARPGPVWRPAKRHPLHAADRSRHQHSFNIRLCVPLLRQAQQLRAPCFVAC